MDVRNVPGAGQARRAPRFPLVRPDHRAGPDAAVVPDLRRPALRHHVAVPGARRAPGGAQGRAAQGRALLRHRRTTAGMAWYRGHFPLQRSADKIEQRYGVPAQTFESSPYYMYHPQAAARIARDLPGVEARRAGPRPGRAGVLAARARGGPRLRAGARLRPRAGAGAGPAAPAGGAARRRPGRTTASPTSTTPTGPAASTPAT